MAQDLLLADYFKEARKIVLHVISGMSAAPMSLVQPFDERDRNRLHLVH